MKKNKIDRRLFIRSTTLAATGLAMSETGHFLRIRRQQKTGSTLEGIQPSRLFFSPRSRKTRRDRTTEDDLKWMADWGFNL